MTRAVVLLPDDMAPAVAGSDVGAYAEVPDGDLSEVRFYVPPYMGSGRGFEVMAHMPSLEVCQLPTAGFEHAFAYLPEGVTLCNAAGVHDASTAELAVGLILASQRGLDAFARAMPAGQWQHDTRPSLADRHVLILGAGGIATALQRRLQPFECEVSLVGRAPRAGVHGVHQLHELLPLADIVVVAVPLTDATRSMVDADFLSRMRDDALLVNVARGAVVVTADLLAELRSGRLRAALDVVDPEPLPPDHPLWTAPGLLISPHVGGNSTAFTPRIQRLVAAQVERWRTGGPLVNVVA